MQKHRLPHKPRVDIDLAALCENFRLLAKASGDAEAAAVVKCDGYGLGLAPVARSLAIRENCKTFFVAYPETGAELRAALSDAGPEARIFVFNGPHSNRLDLFKKHNLIPVLNSLPQAKFWSANRPDAPAALHIDTGMNRLGAEEEELSDIHSLDSLNICMVMSHLACGSDPDRKMNMRQYVKFMKLAEWFPDTPLSLAASGGALIKPEFHLDLVRLGIGVYGVSPFEDSEDRMKPVATLTAPVLQIRNVKRGETAGYAGKYPIDRDSRLATVALGYGDGFLRAGSNAAYAYLGGKLCPIAGRISMDLIILDITNAPDPVELGDEAEFFGARLPIEDAAAACNTIGYELLTSLGARVDRRYLWDGAPAPAELLRPGGRNGRAQR